MKSSVTPVNERAELRGPKARIDWLDVLRGIAVAGMLLVHVAGAVHGSGEAYDRWLVAFDFLAKGKFYTIFALLFGISFALQMQKVREGHQGIEVFWRRLAGLGLIMLTLQVLFGNSLFYYAVWGVPLLLLRQVSSRRLVIVVIALLCLQSVTTVAYGVYRVRVVGAETAGAELRARQLERRTAAQAATTIPSFVELLRARARDFSLTRALSMANLIRFEWGAFGLALFILGLLAVRHGVLLDPERHRVVLLWVASGGTALACCALLLDKTWDPGFAYPAFNTVAKQGLGLFRTEWLGVAYAACLSLMLAKQAPSTLMRPLASVGRAALTNFALHLLILELLFARWSLGLSLDWRLAFPMAFAIFCLQAAFSSWWLKRYDQGPLERFWRSLTYGRPTARPHEAW